MELVIALLVQLIAAWLLITPAIAVWLACLRQPPRRASWATVGLSLLGPFMVAFTLVVLLWLPAYAGRCGGWLGETEPCGFGRYATETIYWAAMSTAVPGALGFLLGVTVLVFSWMRRGRTPDRGAAAKSLGQEVSGPESVGSPENNP